MKLMKWENFEVLTATRRFFSDVGEKSIDFFLNFHRHMGFFAGERSWALEI